MAKSIRAQKPTTTLHNLTAVPAATGLAARLAVAQLDRRGIDPAPLLQGCGLSLDAVASRKRIDVLAQMNFLEFVSRAVKDDCLGLNLAADVDLRESGPLYYVAASSDTLGDALERIERYVRVANEALVLKMEKGKVWRVGFSYAGVPRHLDRHQMECLMFTFLRLCRHLARRKIVPLSVSFMHHRSSGLQRVMQLFGCEARFGADADEMTFENELRDLPLVDADPYLNEMMVRLCDEAIDRRTSNTSPFRTSVENAIAPLLPHAQATAKTIARRLGLSERTFARRLADEGLGFGEILDQLRRELASRYLEEDLQASQIAWLLGFRQLSSFSHACRRWTGKSPSQFRLSVLANA